MDRRTAVGTRSPEDAQGTDYSDTDNWLSLPEVTRGADTFYLYPTAYVDFSEGAKDICGMDNPVMRSRAEGMLEGQASVFMESTNVFAPFYRQTNLTKVMRLGQDELLDYQHGKQYDDVTAALDYYL